MEYIEKIKKLVREYNEIIDKMKEYETYNKEKKDLDKGLLYNCSPNILFLNDFERDAEKYINFWNGYSKEGYEMYAMYEKMSRNKFEELTVIYQKIAREHNNKSGEMYKKVIERLEKN